MTALYPDKYIYDVAGFPKVLGKDLIRNQVEQMMQYSPTVVLHERVERVEQLPGGVYRLTTHTGGEHFTKVVLFTAGIGAFTARRYNRPKVDGTRGGGCTTWSQGGRASGTGVSWGWGDSPVD